MAIAVTCGSCSAALRVKDAHAGKRIRCPRCQAAVPVPPPAPGQMNAPPARRPAAVDAPPLTLDDIRQAFRGDIRPVWRTAVYRAGILVLAAAMLVLPALYPVVVAAIAVLLYWPATTSL